jgi:hypothetical protein
MARWRIPVSPPRETIGFPIGAGIGVVVADPRTKGEFRFGRGCFVAAAIHRAGLPTLTCGTLK